MTGVEHIVIAMKPIEGGYAENALKHGVAGLNIESARVGESKWVRRVDGKMVQETMPDIDGGASGRWPQNVVFHHSKRCKRLGKVGKRGVALPGGFEFSDTEGQAAAKMKEIVERWSCDNECPAKAVNAQGARVEQVQEDKSGKTNRLVFGDSGIAGRYFKQTGEFDETRS